MTPYAVIRLLNSRFGTSYPTQMGYNYVRNNLIPATRLDDGRWFIEPDDAEAWILKFSTKNNLVPVKQDPSSITKQIGPSYLEQKVRTSKSNPRYGGSYIFRMGPNLALGVRTFTGSTEVLLSQNLKGVRTTLQGYALGYSTVGLTGQSTWGSI